MKKSSPEYDPTLFGRGYYGDNENGGFGEEIKWDNHHQQDQLAIKWALLNTEIEFANILFVGCALGAEVRYFLDKGKQAYGIETSKWAVDNQYPEIDSRVKLFNGYSMPFFADQEFDAVACFDVLTLLPREMLQNLAGEMRRVTKKVIVFRSSFKNWRNRRDKVDGEDGVTFCSPEFYDLDRAFSSDAINAFNLKQCLIDGRYIGTFYYTRR